MKIFSLTFVLISTLVTNCQEEVQSSDIEQITFGASFGNCVGYCTQTLELSEGKVVKSLIPRVNADLKEKSCERSFESFESLISKIDFAAFVSLEETIGCPDCADGGAEWIEIITTEGTKRVTYEFRKEPRVVKPFIKELRSLHAELGECDA